MGFRTKLDYSSNRQISQREKTDTILSGSTVFGLPFSGLTVGPDLNTSGITSSLNLAGAAGGSSGYYLPIVINGTTYKIVLNNN